MIIETPFTKSYFYHPYYHPIIAIQEYYMAIIDMIDSQFDFIQSLGEAEMMIEKELGFDFELWDNL